MLDWVDLARGDPAIDLQVLWSLLDPPDRAAFLDAYGPADDTRLLRARVVALSLNAFIALYAHAEGHAGLERQALAALDRAATG